MHAGIDRFALVRRHNPVIRSVLPLSPLSVGNGEFAYTVDVTGMQSFPEAYRCPLGTQAQWAWHTSDEAESYTLADVDLTMLPTRGRTVGYPLYPGRAEAAYHWLRQNPHRVQLGQIGMKFWLADGRAATVTDLSHVHQVLDLVSGVIHSTFRVAGEPVQVRTCCHPASDQIAVRIASPLLRDGRLVVEVRFPDVHVASADWREAIRPTWDRADLHHTAVHVLSPGHIQFVRTFGRDGYRMHVRCACSRLDRLADHAFCIRPVPGEEAFELVFGFAPLGAALELAPAADIERLSAAHWQHFWQTGGAVDLSGSRDERAGELERRIVLSQYVTAVHCAGSMPPQETGLVYNSWFGKSHLEMHLWHAAHFALWRRPELLLRSMGWYERILPVARALARAQGFAGARWPKMVGPDGQQSPSPIAPLLIWQQPHPIVLAELCYQTASEREVLERFCSLVLETAAFMADFAAWDEARGCYVLPPPLIPAQEVHDPRDTFNPAFELEYWRYGLVIAMKWCERLGMPVPERWRQVCARLARPRVHAGLYLAHERCLETFTRCNRDHPSLLFACGLLPGELVDRAVMRATLARVLAVWDWDSAWGWDFPAIAMTAARLGDPALAVDILLLDVPKNTYLQNGMNYQSDSLLAYLPGNGALLTAVAMMAAGWDADSAQADAPGFPHDGRWTVRYEGLCPLPAF
ncbi:hypothetical protein GCM10010885_06610 [Alicyclobacillus cellulosilyticus]|uniref:Glycoside hydrolase family 65 n=1 Tax=Alicyclobacillus cellulosilyticus TaxID=1003997 RepID=A0A917K3U9_9BACL|nr:glycoside hydrolase family 65 [Alicyclobacillus cellulosilyticus]GGJ00009.1 hypothetical protein GCM10010885_06610 [Alicyclobacillus cellulosilyticus]